MFAVSSCPEEKHSSAGACRTTDQGQEFELLKATTHHILQTRRVGKRSATRQVFSERIILASKDEEKVLLVLEPSAAIRSPSRFSVT